MSKGGANERHEREVGGVSELPEGWAWAALGDILSNIETGKSFKCEERPPTRDEVGVVKVSAVTWGRYDENESKTCFDPDRVNAELFVQRGDFLFSRANTIELVGACVIAEHVYRRIMLSDKILRFHFEQETHKPWVLQLLRSKEGRRQIEALSSGNQESMRNIGQDSIRQIQVPVPPAAEQTRIVEKLEELLSDLDAGVSELKAAQKKLGQYRQSLLKAAVEGALTAQWRTQHTPTETGAQLLERILKERRARWEAKQLAKFEEQGKAPPKDWQKKYPEPVRPESIIKQELPNGWTWATIDQLSVEQKYGSSSKTAEDISGIPVIRMGNIQEGRLDLGSLKYLPKNHNEFPDLFLQDGDLLFNRTNSPELVGKTAIYRTQIAPCSYASYLIAVRFTSLFIPEFASFYINSAHGRSWVKSVVTQQVGQANVNGSKLAALAIPVPPIDEQREIIRNMDAQLVSAWEQENLIEKSLKQSAAQRKNILKAAFSGQLVPQDPGDEPAAVLLARIRAERAGHDTSKKPRGRKAKEAA